MVVMAWCLPSVDVLAEQALRQIKTCSVLGKHVYTSGGHAPEKPETVRLLASDPKFSNQVSWFSVFGITVEILMMSSPR